MQPRISMIAALGAETRVIGRKNQVPWRIPADLKRFREITTGRPVLMGRKTWESIPEKFRPLPGRDNIIVTRQEDYEAVGAFVVHSLDEGLGLARAEDEEEIFIIGGGELYAEALPLADRLYLTLVHDPATLEGDVLFPPYPAFGKIVESEDHLDHDPRFSYLTLERG